jgi:hypothetical protein
MRRNLVAEIMAERVSYGGFCATRYEVYADCRQCGLTELSADRMCHALKRLPDDEADAMRQWSYWKDKLPR